MAYRRDSHCVWRTADDELARGGTASFPVGLLQFQAVLDHGLAYARSNAFIDSPQVRALTWLRGIGVVLFITGGVIPISWFMVTRWSALRYSARAELPPRVIEKHAPMPVRTADESYVPMASD